MLTVALVGPDGAGKSTVGRRLEAELGLPARYVYMGVNLESSNLVLPTTRLILEIKRRRGGRPDMAGPPDPDRVKPLPNSALKRAWTETKGLLRMANLMAEEWYRQIVVWRLLRQGKIVICDRHFFPEYWAHDMRPGRDKPLARRLHGWVLRRWFPRPDAVVLLDAPAEVLLARKGEGTVESLERRRREYGEMEGVVERFARVDVSRPPDEVVAEVIEFVRRLHDEKTGAGRPTGVPLGS